jgi:hypothetical protein
MPKQRNYFLLPVDGTVLETKVVDGRSFVKGDPSDDVRPVSFKSLALTYGVDDYPDAEPGEHPDGFGVDQHKYQVTRTGDAGTLADGYGGYTLTTFCCAAMKQWATDLEAAIRDDDVVTRRSKMDDYAPQLKLDR